jgi:hypothetical protein
MLDHLREFIRHLSPQPLDPHVEQLVTRAIEQVDPRLKSFNNYPRAYIPAITAVSRYVKELAATLPECIDLSPSFYAQQPLLHALFSDVGGIYNTVRESHEIKAYCREQGKPEGGELFALMGMRRHQKTVFGRQINGESVQQDVQQTMVYFDAHTLSLPAESREQFGERLEAHLFNSLIKSLSEYIAEGIGRRHDLEIERDILASRLRGAPSEKVELEAQLAQLREQLEPLSYEFELSRYGKLFDAFMAEPQQHLRLEQCEMPIDMRGVMRESTDRLAGRFIFYDLVGRDRRRWTLCPVRLSVDELQQAMHCGSDRERWMEF